MSRIYTGLIASIYCFAAKSTPFICNVSFGIVGSPIYLSTVYCAIPSLSQKGRGKGVCHFVACCTFCTDINIIIDRSIYHVFIKIDGLFHFLNRLNAEYSFPTIIHCPSSTYHPCCFCSCIPNWRGKYQYNYDFTATTIFYCLNCNSQHESCSKENGYCHNSG
jgi:hypothetical protein